MHKITHASKQLRNKILRPLQYVTGIHRIHHIVWSYGYKLPFVKVGYFHYKETGFKRMKGQGKDYHDCTITGIY